MKKHLLLLLATSISILLQAQDKSGKEPYLMHLLKGKVFKNADIRTYGGNISLTGVNESEARVEVYIKQNNPLGDENISKEEIQKRIHNYELIISVNDNKLTASAKLKEKLPDWSKSLFITFHVFVPKHINAELSTGGGALQIDNIEGMIKGRTSGGDIAVANVTGDVDLGTSGGNITAKNSVGQLSLSTPGGSLRLTALKGVIKANTSMGEIYGSDISGELVTNTSFGNVKLTDLSGSLETSASMGSIDVAIKELGKYIKVRNTGGDVNLQLPTQKGIDFKLSAKSVTAPSFTNLSLNNDGKYISGRINDGDVPVTVVANKLNLSVKQ